MVGEGSASVIEAWNKIDLLGDEQLESTRSEAERRGNVVTISANQGDGVGRLIQSAADLLREGSKVRKINLSAGAGEAIAWLHANGEIIDQRSEGLETEYEVRLSDADWARFQSNFANAA